MPLTTIALNATGQPFVDADRAFNSLPEAPPGFDLASDIADLPQHTLNQIAEQFREPVSLPLKRPYVFGVNDLPQTGLDRDLDIRWEGAKRLGRRVAQQFLGIGEERVTLKGTIYPPNHGRFELLESLRASAMSGRTLTFVTGYGRYLGIWCIKAVKDAQTYYWPNGYPRKIEFTIELVHYGPDGFSLGGISVLDISDALN